MRGNSKSSQSTYEVIVRKSFKLVRSLDGEISKNLKDAGIETRPVKSNGLWCFILLPAVLLINALLYKVSNSYNLTALVSVGLLFYCILFIVFISVSCLVLRETVYGGCIACSLFSALLIYTLLGQGLAVSLAFTLPTVCLYSLLLRFSITAFPKTFTIGEAMLVTQSIVLFAVMAAAKLLSNFDGTEDEMDLVNVVVYTVLSSVGVIVTALCLMTDGQRNVRALSYVVAAAGTFALFVLHAVMGVNSIFKILHFVFMNQQRAQIFTFWLFLVIVTAVVLTVRTKLAVKANTVTRKSFHILASLVFLSGMLSDVALMRLAAGIGLGLLVLFEALRKSNIEPISPALQSAFLVYSDEKDCGSFAMTPMYLYVGLACPLILIADHEGAQLEMLSGILAIGVGDTAASWFGSRYGTTKWPGGERTLEGTAFNILSQIATIYALQLFDLLNARNALIRTTVAATAAALVEAKTDQVDNLVLPLVTILAFQGTWFLC